MNYAYIIFYEALIQFYFCCCTHYIIPRVTVQICSTEQNSCKMGTVAMFSSQVFSPILRYIPSRIQISWAKCRAGRSVLRLITIKCTFEIQQIVRTILQNLLANKIIIVKLPSQAKPGS